MKIQKTSDTGITIRFNWNESERLLTIVTFFMKSGQFVSRADSTFAGQLKSLLSEGRKTFFNTFEPEPDERRFGTVYPRTE